ncbi:MAG: hypothetical protein JSU03_08410 [Bacteroidetes bacterium]|nr:hypothetical protein [Bacteroidota bacterium]
MKRLILLLATCAIYAGSTAQTDSSFHKNDTLRIGNIVIVKKSNKNKSGNNGDNGTSITMGRRPARSYSKVTTNWFIADIGFANYSDNTNYSNTGNYLVNKPGSPAFSKEDFKLKTGKSINVNIWIFMQKLNIIKNNVSLKYGLGLELNNYRYRSQSHISYREGGTIPYSGVQTNAPFIFRDSINFSKNKLAADYLTVPFMLSFATNHAANKKGLILSAGVSAGYLYSQRNKQISSERGKQHNKGDYDLEKFKFSYIGELGIGPVRLYGSYTPKSIYEHSLDIRPFTVGFRFSNL